MTVGVLHPGAMGVTIGACCVDDVMWCSAGRSSETRARADDAGFIEVAALDQLASQCDVIVSVCPPGEALTVADAVAALDFDGLYVDANAIAPSTARSVGDRFERFVDGGIVGPPAHSPGTTRLYLSGLEASQVASRWSAPLDIRVIVGGPGSASALKMAYAMWTKISAALLLDVRALARAEGVEDALLLEWAISQAGTADRSEATAGGVGPKAWRFEGEMEQMAIAARDTDLPDGFAEAAAEIYRRLATFKGADRPSLEDVLANLLAPR
jgi:3-hydroxyisobutyrate dehydrogenase-like beta-hydroxyacid dehydrogenase